MTPSDIVQKLLLALRAQASWNYCNVPPASPLSARVNLPDDLSACGHAQAGGMPYLLARGAQASGDYVEQITFLLFLQYGGFMCAGSGRRMPHLLFTKSRAFTKG